MDLQDWSWEETRATPREKNNTKLLGVCHSNNSRCTFIYLPCRGNLGAKSKSRKHFVTIGYEKKHEAYVVVVWWIKKCNGRPCTCHSPGPQGQLTRWLRDIHSHLEDWWNVKNQETWGHHLTLWSPRPPGGDGRCEPHGYDTSDLTLTWRNRIHQDIVQTNKSLCKNSCLFIHHKYNK